MADTCVASHDYRAEGSGELGLLRGDVVTVLRRDGDWWLGHRQDGPATAKGWFPAAFVAARPAEEADEAAAASAPTAATTGGDKAESTNEADGAAALVEGLDEEAHAVFPYLVKAEDELPLAPHDHLRVLKRSPDGWVFVCRADDSMQKGWVPGNHIDAGPPTAVEALTRESSRKQVGMGTANKLVTHSKSHLSVLVHEGEEHKQKFQRTCTDTVLVEREEVIEGIFDTLLNKHGVPGVAATGSTHSLKAPAPLKRTSSSPGRKDTPPLSIREQRIRNQPTAPGDTPSTPPAQQPDDTKPAPASAPAPAADTPSASTEAEEGPLSPAAEYMNVGPLYDFAAIVSTDVGEAPTTTTHSEPASFAAAPYALAETAEDTGISAAPAEPRVALRVSPSRRARPITMCTELVQDAARVREHSTPEAGRRKTCSIAEEGAEFPMQGPSMVIALFNCSADDKDELSFQKGDIIHLVQREEASEWWEGYTEKHTTPGLFPKSYARDLRPHEKSFLTQLARPGVIEVPKTSIVKSPTYERITDVLPNAGAGKKAAPAVPPARFKKRRASAGPAPKTPTRKQSLRVNPKSRGRGEKPPRPPRPSPLGPVADCPIISFPQPPTPAEPPSPKLTRRKRSSSKRRAPSAPRPRSQSANTEPTLSPAVVVPRRSQPMVPNQSPVANPPSSPSGTPKKGVVRRRMAPTPSKVLEPYAGQGPEELTIRLGDVVTVLSKSVADKPNWWFGKTGSQQGCFPSACVELLVRKRPASTIT